MTPTEPMIEAAFAKADDRGQMSARGYIDRDDVAAMLTAALAASDMVMLPREPTREMWAAGGTAAANTQYMHHDKIVGSVWTAMLSALSPSQPDRGGT